MKRLLYAAFVYLQRTAQVSPHTGNRSVISDSECSTIKRMTRNTAVLKSDVAFHMRDEK